MLKKLEKKFIQEMKAKLLAEKEELETELESFIKADKEQVGFDIQDEDSASHISSFNDRHALERELEISIKEIDRALDKIENNKYGFCDECGKAIPKNRLKAYPAAERCAKGC